MPIVASPISRGHRKWRKCALRGRGRVRGHLHATPYRWHANRSPLLRPEWVVATSDVLEQSLTNGEPRCRDPRRSNRVARSPAIGARSADERLGRCFGHAERWEFALPPGAIDDRYDAATDRHVSNNDRLVRRSEDHAGKDLPVFEPECRPADCRGRNRHRHIPIKVVEAYPLKGALRTILTEPSLTDGRVFSRTAPPRMKRGRTRCYGRWSGSPMSLEYFSGS